MTIDAFKRANSKKVDTLIIPISDRFIDPDTGKPIQFTFRPLLEEEYRKIRKKYENDIDKLDSAVMCAMIANPKGILEDPALLNDYEALDAPELLRVMLFENEFNNLLRQVIEFRSKNMKPFSELVEEQKN
jgi:hypothetical protein